MEQGAGMCGASGDRVSKRDIHVFGIVIYVTLGIMFVCGVFQILDHHLNDIRGTISVSRLSFSYALATIILKVWKGHDELADLADLDLCVAVIAGSMASIWASSLEFTAEEASYLVMMVNFINAVLITIVAFLDDSEDVTITGVTHLQGAAQIPALVAFAIAVLAYVYELYFWVRPRSVAAKEFKKPWRKFFSLTLYLFGTLLCIIVLLYRPRVDGESKPLDIVRPETAFSYGQAYAISAGFCLIVTVLMAWLEQHYPKLSVKVFGLRRHGHRAESNNESQSPLQRAGKPDLEDGCAEGVGAED